MAFGLLLSTTGLLLVSTGGELAQRELPTSPGSLTVTATISSRSPLNAAPDPVELEITVSGADTVNTVGPNGYIPHSHDIEYLVDWYHGDNTNEYSFSAPTRTYNGSAAHTDGHRNARYGYGPKPAHVYRQSYNSTARVYAYEPSSGKFGTYDISISVASEDSAYPTTNTIFVSPSGDFTDPRASGTQQHTGNIASALSTYVFGQSTPKRIMLNEGETHDWPTTNIGTWYGNSFPSLLITSSNPDNPPTCTVSGNTQYDDRGGTISGKFFGIAGVSWSGSFDDTSDTSDSGLLPLWLLSDSLADCIVYDRVTVRGVDTPLLTGDSDNPNTTITMNDVDCENTSYGVLLYRTKFNRMGCRFDSSVNAIVNSTTNAGWGSRFDCEKSYTYGCESHRRQGWSGFGAQIAVQQAERIGTESYVTGGEHYYFGCVFESPIGAMVIGNAQGAADVPLNVVLDMCYFIGGYQGENVVKTGAAGLTMRNCTLLQPDVQGRLVAGDDFRRMLYLNSDVALTALNRDAPIKVYCNNFINRMNSSRNTYGTTAAAATVDNADGFTDVTEENNINHQTDIGTPITTYAPVSDDTNVYSIRDVGYESSTQDLKSSTAPITTAGMSDDYEPEAGSAALDAATTGLVSHFNQRGVARDSTPNIGAI